MELSPGAGEKNVLYCSEQSFRTYLDFCLLFNALLDAGVLPKDDDELDNLSVSCIILFLANLPNLLLGFFTGGRQRELKIHSSIKEAL